MGRIDHGEEAKKGESEEAKKRKAQTRQDHAPEEDREGA
jgi:hypothetical protein